MNHELIEPIDSGDFGLPADVELLAVTLSDDRARKEKFHPSIVATIQDKVNTVTALLEVFVSQ